MSRIQQRAPATPYRPSSRSAVAKVPTVPTQDAALGEKLFPVIRKSLEKTICLFESEWIDPPPDDPEVTELTLAHAARSQYGPAMNRDEYRDEDKAKPDKFMSKALVIGPTGAPSNQSLVAFGKNSSSAQLPRAVNTDSKITPTTGAIVPRKPIVMPKPEYHPPWELKRVISSHTGWVRCLAVDPSNEWFASGGNDRLIKIWDLARGTLKVSLTGHISPVRGLAVSARHPYLFSCGEDKTVKCWDLEKNMVIRHYHGHLSGVYALALHPVLDILVTGGRDKVARVWDMRTKVQIHALTKHDKDIFSVQCREVDPQVITGSHDTTIVLWDLVAGKTFKQLTNHKKSVRAIATHPKLRMFASGGTDNIKQWILPDGDFVQNFTGHNTIINCLAINEDNVMVSGGNEGSIFFWDWKTGHNFQKIHLPPQPGSLDSERGIFAATFDNSSTRLITAEADKSIKIFKIKEDIDDEMS